MKSSELDALWAKIVAYVDYATASNRFPVPGMAVALVGLTEDHGWQTRDAYRGVADVQNPELRIDEHTVFQIASVSKPIATTIIASLTAHGSLGEKGWDEPALGVGLDENPPTLAALLCHRSGLPSHAGDVIEDMGGDRTEVLGKLGLFQREPEPVPYAYTNFGFTAAAVVAARAAHKEWEDLAHDVLYVPLGMTQTSSRHREFLGQTKRAFLHRRDREGRWYVGEQRDPDAQSPAGGVSSTALDLTRWMRLCLGDESLSSDEKYRAELRRIHAPHPPLSAAPNKSVYSLGWNMKADGKGNVFKLSHSGAFSLGGATCVNLLLEEKLGIVVLTNGEPIGVPEAIGEAFTLLVRRPELTLDDIETQTDLEPWTNGKTLLDAITTMMGAEMQKPPRINYILTSEPPKPTQDQLSTYSSPLYGPVGFRRDGARFLMSQGNRIYALESTPDPNVFVYDSAGDMGTLGNGVTFTRTDFARIWVDNLFYVYPQGPEVKPRKAVDTATGVEAILVQRAVAIRGIIRVWRFFAMKPGKVQLRVYDESYQMVAHSDVVTVEEAGFHQLVLSNPIEWSVRNFQYFGFFQSESGVIAYDEDPETAVMIRYQGQDRWETFNRVYSIQIDIDAHGVLTA